MADKPDIDQLFNLRASFPTDEETKAFFRAAKENDLKALGKIIDKWPDAPKKWYDGGETAITKHFSKMTVKTIQYLVQRGADINKLAADGHWSAMGYAAFHGKAEDVEKLLRCGADPDVRNKYEQTPLHWAAAQGHMACADLLVLCGANPNVGLRDAKNDDIKEVINSAAKRRETFLASQNPPATEAVEGVAAPEPVSEPAPVASDNVIHIMKRIELKKAGKDPGPDVADAPSGAKSVLKRIFKW